MTMTFPNRFSSSTIEKYRSQGYWLDWSQADLVSRNGAEHSDKIAFTDARGHYTWKQMDDRSSALAAKFIELGLKKDDCVVTQVSNCAEFYLMRYAAEKAGLVNFTAMPTVRAKEMEHIINSIEAVAVTIPARLGSAEYFQMIEELRPRTPSLKYVFIVGPNVPAGCLSVDEIVSRPAPTRYTGEYFDQFRIQPWEPSGIFLTSGTTGRPKFVMSTTAAHVLIGRAQVERQHLTPDDVLLACAPVTGGPSGTLCKMTAPLVPCRVVLQEKFDAEDALRLIQDEKVTIATGVPAQMVMMLDVPNFDQYDLSSLRAFFYAGSALPIDIARQVSQRMGCRVITVYGLLDIGIATGTSVDDGDEVAFRSVGKPLPGCEMKLVDESGNTVAPGQIGEIVWRGPTEHSACYWRDPEATAATFGDPDGWCATGDLGSFDAEGNVSIVGRKKDIIIRGGQNISPVEVEEILISHPRVLNVAIVAMPDKVMGEKACAFVLPKAGRDFTFDDMTSYLREKKVAPYKLPERLEIIDAFPMAGGGQKIAKQTLREMIAEKLKEEGRI